MSADGACGREAPDWTGGQQCDESGGGRVRKMFPERAAMTRCQVLWEGVVTGGWGT